MSLLQVPRCPGALQMAGSEHAKMMPRSPGGPSLGTPPRKPVDTACCGASFLAEFFHMFNLVFLVSSNKTTCQYRTCEGLSVLYPRPGVRSLNIIGSREAHGINFDALICQYPGKERRAISLHTLFLFIFFLSRYMIASGDSDWLCVQYGTSIIAPNAQYHSISLPPPSASPLCK